MTNEREILISKAYINIELNGTLKEDRADILAPLNAYSTEVLEDVVDSLENGTKTDVTALINKIYLPENAGKVVQAASLKRLLQGMKYQPSNPLKLNRVMYYLDSFGNYEGFSGAPKSPLPGEEVSHPFHIAVALVSDAAYELTAFTYFNAYDEDILSNDVYREMRIVDENLLKQLVNAPESGERIARLSIVLQTLHLDAIRPYLDLVERYPAAEDRIIELLAVGTDRLEQLEHVAAGLNSSMSSGAL